MNISKDQDCFTIMIFLEASQGQQQRALDISTDATNSKIRYMPGFVGAAFLKSLYGERVTEYVQWESEGHFREAMNEPEFFEHIPELRKIATDEVSPYEVHYAAGTDHDVGHGAVEISGDADLFTAIAKFAVGPNEQQELLRLLVAAHEPLFQDVPGFLSACVLRSPDGERVVEYLQFEDREAFDAFEQRAEASVYQEKLAELALAEMSPYEVDFVYTAEDEK